jgi:dolichol-phosphate mannosyltransferase
MDADLSHPPESIPSLYSALSTQDDSTPDFVIGSRYVPGGGTDEDWGLLRKINSRVATWLARPLTRTSDPMAGFFALRRETYQSAEELDPVGFKIALELIVKCGCRHVAEVPIQFHNRKHGQSKLNLKEQINYIRHLKRLYAFRWKNPMWVLLFGCVGLTGFGIDLLLFFLLMQILSVGAAGALSIWGAMSWNYVLNRTVTFRNTPRRPWLRQYAAFCASCLIGGIFNWITRVGLVQQTAYFAAHPLEAAVLGVMAGMVFNFLCCRFFVFANPGSVFPSLMPEHPPRLRSERKSLVGASKQGD